MHICDGGAGEIVGPQTTGPIFIRTGQNNAINVNVQNTVDAAIRVFVSVHGANAAASSIE